MKMKMKRFDLGLPLPQYETELAAGMDLYVRACKYDLKDQSEPEKNSVYLCPNDDAYLMLNIAAEAPKGFKLDLQSRSSTYRKKGVILTNCVGLVQ